MHHSTWDLEVHAREMQERRWREATRARQVVEACRRGDQVPSPAPRFSVARLFTVARTWLSPRRTPVDHVEAPVASEAGLHATHVAEPLTKPIARPSRLSQPYAGMAVLARGPDVQTAHQPCSVGDC
jgi:hypothetical protein